MEEFSLDGFSLVSMDPKGMLRERRVILGLTQKQVAEKANIPMQSYQRFESGERNIMTLRSRRTFFSSICMNEKPSKLNSGI